VRIAQEPGPRVVVVAPPFGSAGGIEPAADVRARKCRRLRSMCAPNRR